MSKEFKTKLNEKQDYGTGATRDAAAGKGRFDLIPDLALERVAKVYERGACNHGARNWEQGIPMSRMIDSALRHIRQYQMGKYITELREEDHLAHAIWNLLGVLHEEEMIERGWLPEDLDDLPRYGNEETSECLRALSDEELDKVDVPTAEQIQESLEKGAKEAESLQTNLSLSIPTYKLAERPPAKLNESAIGHLSKPPTDVEIDSLVESGEE